VAYQAKDEGDMSYETGWCDDCGVPIGVGPCKGCIAYSSVCADIGDEPEDDDNSVECVSEE
jgi:hypothetical protein